MPGQERLAFLEPQPFRGSPPTAIVPIPPSQRTVAGAADEAHWKKGPSSSSLDMPTATPFITKRSLCQRRVQRRADHPPLPPHDPASGTSANTGPPPREPILTPDRS